jgi:hypothetical protein
MLCQLCAKKLPVLHYVVAMRPQASQLSLDQLPLRNFKPPSVRHGYSFICATEKNGQAFVRRVIKWFLASRGGWYLWLGLYTAAINAVAGIACFSVPFLPLLIVSLDRILPAALAFAAPLNIVILPIAFHILRNRKSRVAGLRIAGAVGGFASPTLVAPAWGLLDPTGPWTVVVDPTNLGRLAQYAPAMIAFSIAGSIAGMVCATRFHKHGEKPSLFESTRL